MFAPSHATTESKLPVWFFIQGGGYAGNTDQNFNGTEVIMQSDYSMVFVQINYRVGAFGFLASESIVRDGDLNVGLLDQRKALEWAQKYIHLVSAMRLSTPCNPVTNDLQSQFGGDPNHVVIHGDSAGGGSIAFQLTAYGGGNENLFVGAISESPFLPTHRTVAESEFQFNRFAAAINCSGGQDTMSCLRSKDTATLQSADVVSVFPGAPSSIEPDWYFLPVIDGKFSPDYLYNMLEDGRVTRVPLIIGDDTDEGTDFAPNATSSEEFLQFIQANYPHLDDNDLYLINKSYPLGPVFPLHDPWFTPAEQAYGEATFICPGIEITKSLSQYNSPGKTWNYRYNVYDESDELKGQGVPHVSEKPAIFGPGNAGSCDGCSYLTYNKPIVPIVMNYWISFILTLNPNTLKYSSAPVWQAWGKHGGQRLKIQLGATEMEAVPRDQIERCALWKSLASVSEQ